MPPRKGAQKKTPSKVSKNVDSEPTNSTEDNSLDNATSTPRKRNRSTPKKSGSEPNSSPEIDNLELGKEKSTRTRNLSKSSSKSGGSESYTSPEMNLEKEKSSTRTRNRSKSSTKSGESEPITSPKSSNLELGNEKSSTRARNSSKSSTKSVESELNKSPETENIQIEKETPTRTRNRSKSSTKNSESEPNTSQNDIQPEKEKPTRSRKKSSPQTSKTAASNPTEDMEVDDVSTDVIQPEKEKNSGQDVENAEIEIIEPGPSTSKQNHRKSPTPSCSTTFSLPVDESIPDPEPILPDLTDTEDDILEEEFGDLIDEDRDPSYVPEKSLRKSSRLEGRERLDYNPLQVRRPKDPARTKRENEKKAFYEAIKKYGSKEHKQVAKQFPEKTVENIKDWIYREKCKQIYEDEKRAVKEDGSYTVIDDAIGSIKKDVEKGENGKQTNTKESEWRENVDIEVGKRKRETLAPLDMWRDIIEDNQAKEDNKRKAKGLQPAARCENMIPSSLNWIAEFEDHPDPDICGGIDYEAIYRYFALLAEGEVPPDLDPVSAARVTRLLSDLSKITMGSMKTNENDYMSNYKGIQSRYATDEDFNESSRSVRDFEEMSRLPGMNPLNFHPGLCTDKELDISNMVLCVKPKD
eukprot:TRINITY_DN4925_c0_g1_i6.p1 TRINITY_DN4925_c0_g1~~TRINITY_DN4925_c0_g1_i6.p1  ORF type:complete len:637 (+),score=145.31 TRINITY_DN4925_c0_g1_i6:25-1935(+)